MNYLLSLLLGLICFETITLGSFRSFSTLNFQTTPVLYSLSTNNIGFIESEAIAFPSPAKNGETEIGFQVTKGNVYVELFLYDQFGNQLYQIEKDMLAGYNTIPINSSTLGFELPVGIYYYLLQVESETVSKGKFGVVYD